jgi:hypothetical protein
MSRRWWSEAIRRDDGAFAILFAVTIVLMFAFAALAIDLATFYQNKQQLQNTNDAAALAGAQKLPDIAAAQLAVTGSVTANAPGLPTPQAVFYCVVASTLSGSTYEPDPNQVGTTVAEPKLCYPGGKGYVPQCNASTCAIPCISANCTPNAIRVGQDANVRFSFAPVIGIASGQTNVVESVACKGTCGQAGSNPMDVVVIADRTQSMRDYKATEVLAIRHMLQHMEPSIQRVALSAVGWSDTAGSCATEPSGTDPGYGSSPTAWIPVGLSSDFGGKNGMVGTSAIVRGLDCISSSSTSGTGTWLATPLRVAARYLLGTQTGITGVPLQTSATKAIIFETDGEPNETTVKPTRNGTPVLVNASDPLDTSENVGNSDTTTACSNFAQVVTAAKAAKIIVAFIDYQPQTSPGCPTYPLKDLASVLNGQTLYYKTNDAAKLDEIYQTVLGAISGKSRLIKLPT